jgi:hypothetical protein
MNSTGVQVAPQSVLTETSVTSASPESPGSRRDGTR